VGVRDELQEGPPAAVGARPATRRLREILQISHAFEGRVRRELAVNATDLEAMEHLIQSGPLAPGELARRLGLTPSAITAAVDRLERLGHAARTVNPDDRRGVVVTASPASRDKAMGLILPMVLAIDATLDGFDAQEQAVITVYLDRVLSAYRSFAEVADDYLESQQVASHGGRE
jgi:DNA-binding MarR family transcriptional regulator